MMTTTYPSISTAQQQSILQQLQRARSAHLRWRAYAQALVSGYDIEEGQLPLEHTDCQFGHWYYGAGQQLKELPAFRAVEEPHQQLHATYQQLYRMVLQRNDPTVLDDLLVLIMPGFRQRRQNDINRQLEQLIRCSEQMLGALDALAHELRQQPSI